MPKKSNFIFNLRDLSKVFQGLSLATQKTLPELTSFIRFSVHEMRLVFCDWLLEEKDYVNLALILNTVTEDLKMDSAQISSKERILFGDFIEKDQDMKS